MADDPDQLLAFLRGRDVPCPQCGYNLRDLTETRCPECHRDLALTVGVTTPGFGWLLVAIAPSIFSAIAAGLLLVPMLLVPLVWGGEPAPWPFVAVEAFGWLSALGGLLLFSRRYVFLRQSPAVQARWAVGAWAVHVTAFLAFLAIAITVL